KPDASEPNRSTLQRSPIVEALHNPVTIGLLGTAAAVIAVLTSQLILQPTRVQPTVATVVGMTGSVIWTGDGGQVRGDLAAQSRLPGGTIEGLTADSCAEIEFPDGSRVTVSGVAALTYSDRGQKELYFREGDFSANVKPQPTGKPMLVHTRTATIQVMGTQFTLDATPATTVLDVSEGKVQLTRLSDGKSVEVPADHRVIAQPDTDLLVRPAVPSVHHWHSRLTKGLEGGYGKWLAADEQRPARLKAIPYILQRPNKKPLTLYTTSFAVSSGESSPVVLQPGATLLVAGSMTDPKRLFIGMTLGHPGGDFAGNFQVVVPAEQVIEQPEFRIECRLDEFLLDPSLQAIRDRLPERPDGMIVQSIWCHTLNQRAGLEITEVELVEP
ncbi:MAG: FecR family protein, partial [Planctomycetota bacterium]